MKLGFGQIEEALSGLHNVLPERRSAFRARLRYLQRAGYGIPRSGVGRKSNFHVGHAVLFDLGLELQQFGLTPTHVAELINGYPDKLIGALRQVCLEPGSENVLLFFYPTALSFLEMPDGHESSLAVKILAYGSLDEGELYSEFLREDGLHRGAFLNLSLVVDGVFAALANAKGADLAPYYAELAQLTALGAE